MWNDLPNEVDQVWAEAYAYWTLGEPLYLSKEVEELAREQQEEHRENSGKEGAIREFLDREILSNWDSLTLMQHRQFYAGTLSIPEGSVLVPRSKVCAAEIWQECFNGELRYMNKKDSMEINNIMLSIEGWKRNKAMRRYGFYGVQRGFERA